MTMRIRLYRTGDTERLARIYREAALQTGAQTYSSAEVAVWAALVDDLHGFGRQLAQGITLIAETDTGDAAAFGQLQPADRIALLYTAPGFGRESYATGIYRLLEARAREAGVDVLHAEASRIARGFFEKQGFELVDREQVKHRGVTFERLRMSKPLTEPLTPGA